MQKSRSRFSRAAFFVLVGGRWYNKLSLFCLEKILLHLKDFGWWNSFSSDADGGYAESGYKGFI